MRNEKDLKIVFVTAGLPYLELPDLIKFARNNKFQGLDLACWPRKMIGGRYVASHLDLHTLIDNFKIAARAKRMFKNLDLEISALTFNDNLLDQNLESRTFYHEHLKKIIRVAYILGVKTVVTFVGRNFSKSIEENVNEFRLAYTPLVKFAKEHEVKIAIEHCPMEGWQKNECQINNICHSPRMWKLLSDLIPKEDRDYFGLCLDPSHLVWQEIDYIKVVYEFKDKIFHVHAKDVEIDKENLFLDGNLGRFVGITNPWDKVSRYIARMPGDGDVDWKAFFKALRDINYRSAISIEPEDPRFECANDSAMNQALVMTGIQRAREFLAPLCYVNRDKMGKYIYGGQ